MKRLLASIAFVLCACVASAYDFVVDGIYYSITSSTARTVAVTFRNYYDTDPDRYSGNVTIPESVTYHGTTYSVTNIENRAFYGCTGLTSVTIGNSVTSVGLWAFQGCSNLTSVTIGNNVTSIGFAAFYECTGLTSIAIGEGVTNIGNCAFASCSGLTSITIPNSVTSIGDAAFQNCSSLTSVTIPNSVTEIGWHAFYDCSSLTSIIVEKENPVYDSRDNCNAIIETTTNTLIYGCQNTIIPNSVTTIGNDAFWNCSNLTSITIPYSVTSIGWAAFGECYSLTSIEIPNSVTEIGSSAFFNCTGLTSIEIPESVTSIGSSVFHGCSSLTSIEIPNSVTSIDENAFYDCTSLTSVTIPNSVTSIGNSVFWGCTSLTSVAIPNSLTSISYQAFVNCTSLTSVTIPNSVTSIGESAFYGCSGLTSVTIGSAVIGEAAFQYCDNLTSVTIGSGVTRIGKNAFSGCKIRQLLSKCTTPPRMSSDAFVEQTYYHTTLYTPMGCWDAYAYSDTWYRFINIRETATEEEEVKEDMAYTLMNTKSFLYAIYDNVNEAVRMVASTQVDESNPNHCWQTVEIDGKQYLYNIGAKLFAVPATDGSAFTLSETVGSISIETGEDGIVIGGKTDFAWALVTNEYMPAKQGIDEIITAVTDINTSASEPKSQSIYDLNGRKLTQKQKGVNIIRQSGGNVKRVMVK